MSDYRELLLGCGRARDKRMSIPAEHRPDVPGEWVNLTTADINEAVKPDHVLDLDARNWWRELGENRFDEVHAYEVLEHLGGLGDMQAFFDDFYNIWQVLKPGGYLAATVPSRYSEWLWGDPGHRRAILPCTLQFLQQPFYGQCDGPHPTTASDYRYLWLGDFEVRYTHDDHTFHRFILQAVKPTRRVLP